MKDAFGDGRYLSLETFRQTGTGVRTPVWFAADGSGTLYLYSRADAGKVKRIRGNQAVRIAPCDMRGKIAGPWSDASARITTGPEAEAGMALLNRKYRPWKQIGDLFARLMGNHPRAVIAIGSRESAAAATSSAPAHRR